MPDHLAPEEVPGRLAELSSDVRAAVLVDEAGGLVASSEPDAGKAGSLAELTVELLAVADHAAGGRAVQVEAQVEGGAVFATRESGYALAAVTRRLALAALILHDMRMLLRGVESPA
jgi:hypothetical protein